MIAFSRNVRKLKVSAAFVALASFAAGLWAWRETARPAVTGSLRLAKAKYAFGEPIEAQLTITNTSGQTLYSGMQYPNWLGLTLTPRVAEGRIRKRPNPLDGAAINMLVFLKPLKAGEIYSKKVYLDRYLAFLEPGKSLVKYDLVFPFFRGPDSKSYVRLEERGNLEIAIEETDSNTLEALLAAKAKGLWLKGNAVGDAMEALRFLDTPLAVKYWKDMLKVPGAEISGVEALSSFENAKFAAATAEALSNRNSDVVKAVLETFRRNQLVLSDEKIQSILTADSRDDRSKWYLLEYLSGAGSRRHLALIKPLLNDIDKSLAAEAGKVAEKLRRKPERQAWTGGRKPLATSA